MKDTIWVCKGGKEIEIKDLTEEHAKNILRKLLREESNPTQRLCREDNPLYYDEYWKD